MNQIQSIQKVIELIQAVITDRGGFDADPIAEELDTPVVESLERILNQLRSDELNDPRR